MFRYYCPGAGYDMMGYGPLHIIGGVLTFFFWLIVIILILRLIRKKKLLGSRRHIWMHSSAVDILMERYARGEIDKAEFEAKKKDLEQ